MNKYLLLILVHLTLIPFLNLDSMSSSYAQQWTSESGSLWKLADETGYYGIERCPYCDIFIGGHSPEEVARYMKIHIGAFHDDENPNNGGNNNDDNNDGNGNEDGNANYIYYSPIVDIYDASSIMQNLGIGHHIDILEDYDTYLGYYISYPYISLGNFISFIKHIYKAESTSTSNDYYNKKFIGLSAQKTYIILNNYHCIPYQISSSFNNSQYEYVFVFNNY